jgi:hypothetical protein
MKVRITKAPDGKGKFVSKLQKFTAQMGGTPPSSQEQLVNFIANDIASGKAKEETMVKLFAILGNDFNSANSYYDQVYQMYASQNKEEEEEEETDEATESNKVEIANSPVTQPVSQQNETKISNDLIAEDRDDSDFDAEIYSDYEDPNATTQAKLGGNFKKERRKYVNNILKLAKKELGGTTQLTQSSTPDPTGEEVRNNMKGSFVNNLKNNAQLAVIKEQAENQFDTYMQDGGQEQPYDFTHYTHGDTDVFHDPMNELVQARLGFNKRRGFRNNPYYMTPFMGLTPDMLQMGMMGPISKLDVTRSHWLTGRPSRYSMEFSPMPGMGMGYYLPGYGHGMRATGNKTPGRLVTEQISKDVNNESIKEVANTTNSEAANNATGPKNWNEADYNSDNIPDYLQPDGAGTEDLAMGRNLPVGPVENPNDPTEEIPTEKVITKPKKKSTPKTVTPVVTPVVTPPSDPFGIGAGIENLIRGGAEYLDQGITKGKDWLEKTARETGWKPDSELIAEATQRMNSRGYDPRNYYGSLGMGPQAAQADDALVQTLVFGAPNWGINFGKNAVSQAVNSGSKLLGKGTSALPSGQTMLNAGQTMLNSGQRMLNPGQKLLNPPAGFQFKLPFQIGGIVNDPFMDPYGNLQKFIYGGNDAFTQADLDDTYSKDTTDAYFANGGLTKYQTRGEVGNDYSSYAKQIGDRLGMSLRDDLSAKEMYELAQKAGMSNPQSNTRTQTNVNRNAYPNYFNAGYNRGQFPGMYYDPRLGNRGPGIFPGRFATYAGTWAKPMGMRVAGTNQPYTGMFDPSSIAKINVTKSNWLTGAPRRYTIDYNVNRDASGKPLINLPTSGSLASAGNTSAGSNVPKGNDLQSTLQRETQGLSGRDLRVKERDIKRAFKQGYGSDYAYDDSRNGNFSFTPSSTVKAPGEDKEYIAEFQQKQKDRGLVWNEQQKKWVPNAQNMAAINAATDPNYVANQQTAGNALEQMVNNPSNLFDYSNSPRQSSAPDVKQSAPTGQTQSPTALDYLQGKAQPTSRTQSGTTVINAAGEPITDESFTEANTPSAANPASAAPNPLAAFIQSAIGSPSSTSTENLFNAVQQMKANASPQSSANVQTGRPGFDLPTTPNAPEAKFEINKNNPYNEQKEMFNYLQNMRNEAYPEWRRNEAAFRFGGYYQPGGEKRRIMPQLFDRLDRLRSFLGNDDEESVQMPQQTFEEEMPLQDFYNQSVNDAMKLSENFQNTLPVPEEDLMYQTEYTPEQLGLIEPVSKKSRFSNKKKYSKPKSNSSGKSKSTTSSNVSADDYDKYVSENRNNYKPLSPEESKKAQAAKLKQDEARYRNRNYNSYTDAKNAARQFSDVSTQDNIIFRMNKQLETLRDQEMTLLNKTNKTTAEKTKLSEVNKQANDLTLKIQAEEAKLKKIVDAKLAGKKRFGGIPQARYGFETPVTEDDRTKPALDRMQTMSSKDAGRQLLNTQLDKMREEYGEKPGVVSVDYKNKNMWELNPEIGNIQFNTALAGATGLKNIGDTKKVQASLYNEFYGDASAPETAMIDSGNYDTNTGLFKPDEQGFEGVVKFGGPIYEDGGSVYDDMEEGDEVMMTPEELQEFLNNGGEVEYIY